MARLITTVLVGLLLGTAWAGQATAASTRLPNAAYPSGAHITYKASLSNAQMDCMWNFVCDGNLPNFHAFTEDELHRVTGWGQFAGIQRHNRMWMAFELFASVYAPGTDRDGTPWSAVAFSDLVGAAQAKGYGIRAPQNLRVRTPRGGGAATLTERSDSVDLTVMTCWSGTVEVEAIVMYDHTPVRTRLLALTDLRNQVTAAMAITSEAYAQRRGSGK